MPLPLSIIFQHFRLEKEDSRRHESTVGTVTSLSMQIKEIEAVNGTNSLMTVEGGAVGLVDRLTCPPV